ncbi:MAG: hypothetical protein ACRC3H_22065 [Lachnospiraceae bacterium]
MIKFETITEKSILQSAYYYILEKQDIERKRIEDNPDIENTISEHWVSVYDGQLKEIGNRILELEKIS